MAKSRFSIIMDYFNALHQADLLEKVADRLRTCGTLEDGYINYLKNAWGGENALRYLRKMRHSQESIARQEKNLIVIAQTVRKIAQRTYDTEMTSLEISRKRTYH